MVSIVVPAHNEAQVLTGTLDALRRAAASLDRPWEIVVVDDASTDATALIARDAGARVVPVNLRHIAAVRNAGAREARGDVLVFVDADTVVPPETLAAAVGALDGGAAGGGAHVTFDGPLPWYARPGTAATLGFLRLFTLAAGLSRGSRASVVAAFGCTLGIVPHMAAAIMGLAALFHTSALAFQTLKYLGVAYLLYMAWSAPCSRSALQAM